MNEDDIEEDEGNEPFIDLYAILNVPKTATKSEIVL